MAQSSRYYKIDQDILLEFIYHDQGDAEKYRIEVDDNGSEVMFLDTVDQDPFKTRHLINELGSAVVNFDVTSVSGYIAVENFAARTLLLQNGKTYKFDLSALAAPAQFTITGSLGIYSYSPTTQIGEFTPNTNGTVEYTYPGLIGGKVIVDTRANPLFASPDEATGNDINQTIGRYHGVNVPGEDATKYALLGYDSTGNYEMHNFINNSVDWPGGNEADLLNYQTEATQNINFILYDTVRLHLRSGFSFSARGYEGFLFEVTAGRTTGVKNFLTQLVYLNQSNYEHSNPKPFILGETLWSKFINIKIPSLIGQNSEFTDRFYGDGSVGSSDLDPFSNYGIRFALLDSLKTINGFDYVYTGEENVFTVPREDEFVDFTVTVEDATDGDYFNIYGEKDNSIAAFEGHILDRIQTSSDDIVVIFEVEVFEQVGTSFIKTGGTTFTQYEDFSTPLVFRPVIQNANVAVNFSIDVTMRIYNQTDNTQIVKKAALTVNNPAKYGKRLSALKIDNPNIMTEVYNILPSLSSNKTISGFITDNLPRSVKFVPSFIERHNVIASSARVDLKSISSGAGSGFGGGRGVELFAEVEEFDTTEFVNEGDLTIAIPPFSTYIKFVIAKKRGDDFELVSFENAELVILTFNDGKTKLKFNHVFNKEIDMGKGEVLFKINEQNANTIRGMVNRDFYISIDNGADESMVTKGKFTLG
tara:strand:- start:1727 stop:3829 length:2103 start_codon:yes stop_codon:yes gene_type:complete